MQIIEQSHEIISFTGNPKQIERIGRTCYKSQDKITEDSADKFVTMLRDKRHGAMIEFGDIIVRFITNRGVSHELVRHRLASFAQESTRYVKYDNLTFIRPVWVDESTLGDYTADKMLDIFMSGRTDKDPDSDLLMTCFAAESTYRNMLKNGWTPQQAREILPHCLSTEIVMKANVREWRHVLQLRTAKASHPQMVALMKPLLKELQEISPVLFGDING